MFSCGFYDAIDNDRVYSATEFGEMFDGLITDGIYATIGHAFAVVPGVGVQVKVRSGRAWFNKRWSVNTADLPIDLAVPDLLLPRIDAIILEVDTRVITRNNAIKVITGAPNVNPTKPVLTRADGLYQYPLAWVRVDQNVENITASKIENNIGKDPTPFVTGILKSISIDELWNQWEGQFDDWFKDIQAQLSGDVALNLQNQITALQNNKVNVSAKATTAEAQTGTNNSKWMTPLTTSQAILQRRATSIVSTDNSNFITPSLLINYGGMFSPLNTLFKCKVIYQRTSGTIALPSDAAFNAGCLVLCVGAGGGGGGGVQPSTSVHMGGGGGGGGNVVIGQLAFTNSLNVVIGAGGAGGVCGASVSTDGDGKAGGATSVTNQNSESVIAEGGSGGRMFYGTSNVAGLKGGSGGSGGGGGNRIDTTSSAGQHGTGGDASLFGGGGGWSKNYAGAAGLYGGSSKAASLNIIYSTWPLFDYFNMLLSIIDPSRAIPLRWNENPDNYPSTYEGYSGNGYYALGSNGKCGGGGGIGQLALGGKPGTLGGGGGGGFNAPGGNGAIWNSTSNAVTKATSGGIGAGGGGGYRYSNTSGQYSNGGAGGAGLVIIIYPIK